MNVLMVPQNRSFSSPPSLWFDGFHGPLKNDVVSLLLTALVGGHLLGRLLRGIELFIGNFRTVGRRTGCP